MNFFARHKYLITGIMIGAVAVLLLSRVTTERKLNDLQTSLESSIETSVQNTTTLARVIGEGRLTKTAETIITDCTPEERNLFEAKLAKLDAGVAEVELNQIDKLFSRCAPVQSIRRTLMVMDLARQIEGLEVLVNQRKQLGTYTTHDELLADAKVLLAHEEKITQLSLDLVYLQREILDALLAGESVSSERSKNFKDRGYNLRTELQSVAEEAVSVRDRVLSS